MGIGRASIGAACFLIHWGYAAREALHMVGEARQCAIPDTHQQKEWVLEYESTSKLT